MVFKHPYVDLAVYLWESNWVLGDCHQHSHQGPSWVATPPGLSYPGPLVTVDPVYCASSFLRGVSTAPDSSVLSGVRRAEVSFAVNASRMCIVLNQTVSSQLEWPVLPPPELHHEFAEQSVLKHWLLADNYASSIVGPLQL